MMNVYIKPIESDEETRITNATERSLYGYFWLNDSRLAYVKDEGGDENVHIFAIDIDGQNEIDLTPYKNIKAGLMPPYEIISIKT